MKIRVFVLLLFPILLISCGTTTQITSSWKAEDVTAIKYQKILVLGLIRDNERILRENMEQHLSEDLRSLGYNAVCSCNEYNPKTFENLNEKEALYKLKNSGVDAVLTIVLLDKSRERYYLRGKTQYSPYSTYQNSLWYYSSLMFDRIHEDEYYLTDTRYVWESNLYDLKNNKLIYSSQSQSFDPNSIERLSHEYGQIILKDMVKKNILQEVKAPVMKAM